MGRWERSRTPGLYRREGPRGLRYKVVYRDPTGRQVTRNFTREKDAAAFLHDTVVKKTTGAYIDPAAGKITFAEHFSHFLATSTARPSTRAAYESRGKYLLDAFGSQPLRTITKSDVRKLKADLTAMGKGEATIESVQRLLHAALAVAVAEDKIARNPADGVKVTPAARREPRFLSGEEVKAIAREVPARYKALVYTLAYGGLRIGEATALRVRAFDSKNCTIRVTENAPEVRGHKLLGQKTKTGQSRTVDIPADLCTMLREHLAVFGNRFDADSLVFTASEGGPVRQNNFRKRVFQPAAERAKITPTPTVHDLRHTAASLFAKAGLTLSEAAEQLGHSSTTMTARYSHVYPDARQTKIANLAVIV